MEPECLGPKSGLTDQGLVDGIWCDNLMKSPTPTGDTTSL